MEFIQLYFLASAWHFMAMCLDIGDIHPLLFSAVTKNSALIFIFSLFISKFPRALILQVSRPCSVTILTEVWRRITSQQCKWLSNEPFLFTAIRSVQFNQCFLQNDSIYRRLPFSSSISWHPLISDNSQYSLTTTLLLVFLLFFFPLVSPKNTFFTVLQPDILIRWPTQSILLSFIVVTRNKS